MIYFGTKTKLKQNSIVRAVSGDTTACEKIPEEIIDFDFDKTPETNTSISGCRCRFEPTRCYIMR